MLRSSKNGTIEIQYFLQVLARFVCGPTADTTIRRKIPFLVNSADCVECGSPCAHHLVEPSRSGSDLKDVNQH